jgi:signal transduction histidine kinase
VALFLVTLILGDHQVLGRLAGCGVAFLYVASAQLATRYKHPRATAYMLVAFYIFFAAIAVWIRGVNSPVGIFAFGLATVIAGILLKASCAFRVALVASMLLFCAQIAAALGWHVSEVYAAGYTSSFVNALEYSVVFGLLALVSWFYNREVDHSSVSIKQAEAALATQKATLNKQIKKRASKLEQIQLEEIKGMYRFAELGQMGVTLLHDLANHLAVLTLEIEGMQDKRHIKAIDRARHIIRYLESTVDSTRDRLHGSTKQQPFNIIAKTSEAVAFLHYKAERAGVTIDWEPPAHTWMYHGDPTGYSQVIAIVASNAIDAYGPRKKKSVPAHKRQVVVTMTRSKTHITLHIGDWGKGIPKKEQQYLFKPLHSTKKAGLGIGLFMARQTIEAGFSGTLTLNSAADHTEFIITLPVGKPGKTPEKSSK